MKLLEAIISCRETGKKFKAKNGSIECIVEYDKSDGSVSVDFIDEEEGFGFGHFFNKRDSESEIKEIVDDVFEEAKDLNYK